VKALLLAGGFLAGFVLNGALWWAGEPNTTADAYRCGYLNAVREANPALPDDRHCMELATRLKAYAVETNP